MFFILSIILVIVFSIDLNPVRSERQPEPYVSNIWEKKIITGMLQ